MNRSVLWSAPSILVLTTLALAAEVGQGDTGKIQVLSLQQVVRMAVDHSPEVAVARTAELRAGESVRETRSLNLPQVVTGTGLAYNNGFPLSIEGSAPSIVQFSATQTILSKKNKNLILEAEEGQKSTQIGLEAARNDLAVRAALTYDDLHLARKIQSLWSGRVEGARKQGQVSETLLEAGKVRPVDVTLARTAIASAEHQLLVAREQVRLTESTLRSLTGIASDVTIETVDPHVETDVFGQPADMLYARALENHPEIMQAQAEQRRKEFHLQAEKGEFYPRLDLVAQYALFSKINNYQDYFSRFSRNNYVVGVSIQVPVFNGFRTSAVVAQSRHEVAESRLRLDRLKNALRAGIEQAISQLRIARGAGDLARLEVSAAVENLKVNESLFEGGRIPVKELEEARSNLQGRQIAELDTEKTLWQRQIDLLRLTSSLSPLF